jgi:hypothetical protein
MLAPEKGSATPRREERYGYSRLCVSAGAIKRFLTIADAMKKDTPAALLALNPISLSFHVALILEEW